MRINKYVMTISFVMAVGFLQASEKSKADLRPDTPMPRAGEYSALDLEGQMQFISIFCPPKNAGLTVDLDAIELVDYTQVFFNLTGSTSRERLFDSQAKDEAEDTKK